MRVPNLRLGSLVACAALLAFAACSSSSARPPIASGCTDAGGCAASSGGGGGGGGGGSSSGAEADGAAAGCLADPAASACEQCDLGNCCSELEACAANSDCTGLAQCVGECFGGPTCTSTCQRQHAAGQSLYAALTSCQQQRCAVCAQSGVGDPCGQTGEYPCEAGLFCSASGWCTKACTTSADCAGEGPNGGDVFGQTNQCVSTSSGPQCVPGCGSSAADCASFAAQSCAPMTTLDGPTAFVCSSGPGIPDAGGPG